MLWFDYITVVLFFIVAWISVFSWVFMIVTFWRKKDNEKLFPPKKQVDKRVSDLQFQKEILDFYNKFKNNG